MTDDLIARLRARAGNPATIHDMAQGLSPAPRIFPRATPVQIAATEAALGVALPDLLKRIYAEIGNGGFGPGYGLIGVQGGSDGFAGGTLDEVYREFIAESPAGRSQRWPEQVVPVCTWGCGIYSCMDCGRPGFPVLVYDPETHVMDGAGIIEATLTNAAGEVIWQYEAPEGKSSTEVVVNGPPREIALVQHKASFQEWIATWAAGVDLWEELILLK